MTMPHEQHHHGHDELEHRRTKSFESIACSFDRIAKAVETIANDRSISDQQLARLRELIHKVEQLATPHTPST